MHATATKVVAFLFLVLVAVIPMACGDSGASGEPRKETTIGGSKGIVVEHGGGEGADVKIGGDKGIVVDHR